MKKTLLLIFFCWIGTHAFAQYFQTGQDPASIKWRQIDTENFQLVYPDYYEEQAQELAGKLEAVYNYGSFSLKHKPRKISVILHTQTVKSNGLVAWAPKRSEFYTTPHQSIYPQDWLEQLVLHEFRHVVQIDKVDSLLPGFIKTILGEQGTALAFGSYLPWWFIEGDAVVTETALSNNGRGRFPSFLMEHRAQVVQKGVFSYDKAYFGSYSDFVPNHYKLGYYLVGSARARYGSKIWDDVLTQTGKNPLSIFPVNKILKDYSGFNKTKLYYSVFDSLQTVWTESDDKYKSAPYEVISPSARNFTSYIYNHWLDDFTLISYKESFTEIPSFVKIGPNASEKRIFSPGSIFNESTSYREKWVVWSEQIADPRWSHSGKSLIRLFNIQTREKIEIYPEFKGFSPAIAPDKTKIVVVETDFSNNYFLSVYQLPTGKLIERFRTGDNHYFFSPEWINNNEVGVISLSEDGKRLCKVDFRSEKMTVLFEKEMGDLKHLKVSGNQLYFISSYSGKNSLYKLQLSDHSVERIYEPRFGVESPAISPDGSKIVLSDYTADGFRLIQVPAYPETRTSIDEVEEGTFPLADVLSKQEMGIPDFAGADTVRYASKKYSKSAHLFNFHSWAPLSIDATAYEIAPGASLMSQNKLGTTETVLGYKWDVSEKTGQYYANFSYKGWYPVFDIELENGKRASEYRLINKITGNNGFVYQDTIDQRYTWRETRGRLKAHLPLNFEKGIFSRFIQPEIQYGFTSYKPHASAPEGFQKGNFHSLGYRLYLHQIMKKSFRDVYPGFGIVLDATYRHSPAGSLNPGSIKGIQSVLFLPGVITTHGIKLYGGAQKIRRDRSLGFSDIVKYARGWARINTHELYTTSVDYKMPLIHPDWNLWETMYIRRVKFSLFGDYTRLKGPFYENREIVGSFQKDISSLGAELTADVNLLKFYAPVDIGIRASFLPEMNDVYFDFLFSIDFTSF